MPDYKVSMPVQVAYKVPGESFEFKDGTWYIDKHRISEQFTFNEIQGFTIDARSGGSELGSSVFILSDFADYYTSGGYVPSQAQGQVALNPFKGKTSCPDIAGNIALLYYKGCYYPAYHSEKMTRVFPFAIGADSMKNDIGEIQFYVDNISSEVQLLNIIIFGKLNNGAGVFTNDQMCAHSALAMGTINLSKGVLTYIMPDYVGFSAEDQLDYIESDSSLLHLTDNFNTANLVCASALEGSSKYAKAVNMPWYDDNTSLPRLDCKLAPDIGIIRGKTNLSRFVKSDEDYFTLEYLPYFLSITCDNDVQMTTLILGYIVEFKLLCKSANLTNQSVTRYLTVIRAVLCELLAGQLCSIKGSSECLVSLRNLLSVNIANTDESIWVLNGNDLNLKDADKVKHIISGLDVDYAFPDAIVFYLEQDLVLSKNLTVNADALMRSDFTEIAYTKLAKRLNSQITFKQACSLSNAKENFRLGLGGTGQRRLPSSIPFALGVVERDAVRMSQAYLGIISDPSMILQVRNGLLDFEVLGPYAMLYLADFCSEWHLQGTCFLVSAKATRGLYKDIRVAFTNLVYAKMRSLSGTKVNIRDKAVLERIGSDYGINAFKALSDSERTRIKERTRLLLAAERSARLSINVDSYMFGGNRYNSRVGSFDIPHNYGLPPRKTQDNTGSGMYNSESTLALLHRFYNFSTVDGTYVSVLEHPSARGRFILDGALIMSGLVPLMCAVPRNPLGLEWGHIRTVTSAVIMLVDIWQRVLLGDIMKRSTGIDTACKYRVPNNATACVEKYHAYPQTYGDLFSYGWRVDKSGKVKFGGVNLVANRGYGKNPFIRSQIDYYKVEDLLDNSVGKTIDFARDFLVKQDITRDGDIDAFALVSDGLPSLDDVMQIPSGIRNQYLIPGTKIRLRPSCWVDSNIKVHPFTSQNIVYSMSYINTRVNAILALSDENAPDSFFTKYTEFYEKFVQLLIPVFSAEDSDYVSTVLYIFNAYLQKTLPEFTIDAALAELSKFDTIDDLIKEADTTVISTISDVQSANIIRRLIINKESLRGIIEEMSGDTDDDVEVPVKNVSSSDFSLDDLIKDMDITAQDVSEPTEELTLSTIAAKFNGGTLNELQPRFKFLSDIGDKYNEIKQQLADTPIELDDSALSSLTPTVDIMNTGTPDLSAFEGENVSSNADENSIPDLSAFEGENTDSMADNVVPDLSQFEGTAEDDNSADEMPDLAAFEGASMSDEPEKSVEVDVNKEDPGEMGTADELLDTDVVFGTGSDDGNTGTTKLESDLISLDEMLAGEGVSDVDVQLDGSGDTENVEEELQDFETVNSPVEESAPLVEEPISPIEIEITPSKDSNLPNSDELPSLDSFEGVGTADEDNLLGGLTLGGDINNLTSMPDLTPKEPKKIFTDMPPLEGEYQIPQTEEKTSEPADAVSEVAENSSANEDAAPIFDLGTANKVDIPTFDVTGSGVVMGTLGKIDGSATSSIPNSIDELLGGNKAQETNIEDNSQADNAAEEADSTEKSTQGELLFNPSNNSVADSWQSARDRKLRFGRLLVISPEDKSSVQCGYCGGAIRDIEKFCSLNGAFIYLDSDCHVLINIRGSAHFVYAYYSAPRDLMTLIDNKEFSLEKCSEQFNLKQITLSELV